MFTNDAIAHLTTLSQIACRTEKRGNAFRFRFRRTGLESLAGVNELVDMGLDVKVYTGSKIHSAVDGFWSTRQSSKVRSYTVVEVAL